MERFSDIFRYIYRYWEPFLFDRLRNVFCPTRQKIVSNYLPPSLIPSSSPPQKYFLFYLWPTWNASSASCLEHFFLNKTIITIYLPLSLSPFFLSSTKNIFFSIFDRLRMQARPPVEHFLSLEHITSQLLGPKMHCMFAATFQRIHIYIMIFQWRMLLNLFLYCTAHEWLDIDALSTLICVQSWSM